MLIATAGHIDHGKTALVRALTGVETDRLPEEQARGITIDLGFAYWRADGGEAIGFVDVPGHERYLRNMLAGVGGVSFALVIVAADDGVMPQTVEHVQILNLLGIARGALAITKCDKVDDARIAAVRAQALALLAGTGLADAPVFPVSAVTGAGVVALGSHLRAAALADAAASPGAFRMGIDRCFTVNGAGTVATGTVLAGTLEPGEQLMLSPMGRDLRVRGLQSAGRAVQQVRAGQRCAINLAGIEVAEVHRGDWLVAPALHAPTSRIEARVQVLPGREAPLRHGASVHLHLGTAALPARVLSRRQTPIQPGTSQVVTLVLGAPTSAVNGDRFVLRDHGGRALIGGGRVIDPLVPARLRRDETRAAVTAALELHDPAASLAALLAVPGHEPEAAWFERTFNLTAPETQALCKQAGAEAIGRARPALLASARITAICDDVLALLARWHRDHPDVGGLNQRDIRRHLASPVSADVLGAELRLLADAARIAFAGALVHLPGHTASFSAAEIAMWQAMLGWLEDQPPRTVTAAELKGVLQLSEGAIRAMLYRRRVSGDLWAVTEGRFMLRGHVAMLVASAAELAARHETGFTAAQFRDATAIGRNHVIRLLEFFDRIGVTARRGDARVMRAGHETVVGSAPPWLPGGPG